MIAIVLKKVMACMKSLFFMVIHKTSTGAIFADSMKVFVKPTMSGDKVQCSSVFLTMYCEFS